VVWGLQHTNIPCLEPASKTQHSFVSVLLRTSCVHLSLNTSCPASHFEWSEWLFVCIRVYWTEHAHHHLHKKMLLPPAWCHWIRVTGGCLCHPSEPLTASSLACHSCCLSGQWGRQQVHSLRDSIIHQGAHLKLGPACLHSLRPSHAWLTHTEV